MKMEKRKYSENEKSSKNETDSLGKVLVVYNFESFSIFYGRLSFSSLLFWKVPSLGRCIIKKFIFLSSSFNEPRSQAWKLFSRTINALDSNDPDPVNKSICSNEQEQVDFSRTLWRWILTVCSTIRGISGEEGNVCKRGRFTREPREVWKLSANWTELNSGKQTWGQFPLPVSTLLPHSSSFTFNCSFPPRGGRCTRMQI